MAHVQVANNMEITAPGIAPKFGDRVEYVICASSAKRVVDKAEEPHDDGEMCLAIDYSHYLEAIKKPLLDLLQTPLRALLPEAYDELVNFMSDAQDRARAFCAEHARCRIGGTWKDGHMTKDGLVQTKIHIPGRVVPKLLQPPRKRKKRDEAVESSAQCAITCFLRRGVD